MDTEGGALTVIVILVEVTVGVDTHVALLDIWQVIKSPFIKSTLVKVGVVVTFTPFFFQINVGAVPPFVGVDVKVTDVPEQIVVALAAMDTEGVTTGFTVIVTLFESAFVVVIQAA
jgi:hypothetical protein